MSIDEAVFELKGLYKIVIHDDLESTIYAERKNEAIKMAIEALELQSNLLNLKDFNEK